MDWLENLTIGHNPMKEVPRSILHGKSKEILEFLKTRQSLYFTSPVHFSLADLLPQDSEKETKLTEAL